MHKRKCLLAFCVCMCTIVFVNNCSEPVHSHALYRRTPCTQHFSIIFMTDDLQSTYFFPYYTWSTDSIYDVSVKLNLVLGSHSPYSDL